jgi:hypothetical protein
VVALVAVVAQMLVMVAVQVHRAKEMLGARLQMALLLTHPQGEAVLVQ